VKNGEATTTKKITRRRRRCTESDVERQGDEKIIVVRQKAK
jgi:hypothetical protein